MIIPDVFRDVHHILSSTIFSCAKQVKNFSLPFVKYAVHSPCQLVHGWHLSIWFFSLAQVHTIFQMKFLQWFVQQNYRQICPGCQLPRFQKMLFLFTEEFPLNMNLLSNYLGTQQGYLVSSSWYKYILNQQTLTYQQCKLSISAEAALHEMYVAVQGSSIPPSVLWCSAVRSLCRITAAPGSFHVQPRKSSSGSAFACCPCLVPLMPGSHSVFNNSKRLFWGSGDGAVLQASCLIFTEVHWVSAARSSSSSPGQPSRMLWEIQEELGRCTAAASFRRGVGDVPGITLTVCL